MKGSGASSGPAGFLSYVHADDQHEGGRLTQLRERLTGEVRMQTGAGFEIFQDNKDIKWGQEWKLRVENSLDSGTFLFPIITPGYFKSQPCREELERFVRREVQLGRSDLIFPIYYINCPLLSTEELRKGDNLAATIASRQYADWRDLRFEPFTSPQIGKMIAHLASQIVQALERSEPAAPVGVAATAAATLALREVTEGAPASASGSEQASGQVAVAARGPSDKVEPRTIIVDALHRGDHTTLTGALEAANPGDRILVRPGLYKEGVIIDKPVEIIGDGELGDAVIEATGKNAILFRANMGRVTNLALRQAGGGNWYCVDIVQGRLDLEGCDITTQSLTCVAIHGGADPRLRRNRIHDGRQAGVFVYDNGQGTLEDNDIFGNALAGVAIRDGGNPTLRRNRIHDGRQGGVFVGKDGQGTLEDNDIFGNAFAGVAIKEGGKPTLRENRVNKNGYGAIWVYDGGRGVFERNDLSDNARGAWDIAADCAEHVVRKDNQE